MRHIAHVLMVFFIPAFLFSQKESSFNNALKLKLDRETHPAILYPLLVKADIAKLKACQLLYDYKLHYSAGDIASITCNINALSALIEHRIVSYAEYVEPRTKPMNDTMIYRNRIKAVKHWTANLPQAYDGSGVVLGFIDSGVDFAHPDLQDAFGNTRVKYLWDQNAVTGAPAPAPFNYGVEWTAAQMDANQCTHTDFVHYGHGTHVAGIAAGNGLANGQNEGCAPKTDIVYVALDFSAVGPKIADAVQYIFSKAALLGKPCVINASVGDYYGSHDGTNLEAKMIDNMVSNIPGRVLVASAGNAGSFKYHSKTRPQNGDTLFSWLTNGSGFYDYWCYGDTNEVKNLQISVGANRGNFSDVGSIGFKNYNYALNSVKTDILYNSNNKKIGTVKTSASINPYGVYELYIQIQADTSYLLWRIETKGNGLHHAWNFNFVTNGLPNATQFPKIPFYVVPDTLYSLVSSFQCSDEVITVGNYINAGQYYDMRDTLNLAPSPGGHIAPGSSSGPTRDDRMKPDITASGDFIFSCMPLGLKQAFITYNPHQVAKGQMHVIGGGTSASSPVVAGLVALYLQRFPNATNRQVKDAIRFCAYRDGYTGNNLPDYRWGFGKLDGKATMICGENHTVGLQKNRSDEGELCFPNPFNDKVNINFDGKAELFVYDIAGRLLFKTIAQDHFELRSQDLPLNFSGILFLKLSGQNGTHTYKVIKE